MHVGSGGRVVSGCFFVLAVAGCSVTNSADVCTTVAPPAGVNQLRDGQQSLTTGRTLTVAPTGDTVVMFASSVGSNGSEEAHLMRFSTANLPLEGCSTRDELEQVPFPISPAGPVEAVDAVQVLPAPAGSGLAELGLTLFTDRAGALTQLWAVPLTARGCFFPAGLNDAFNVSELAVSSEPNAPLPPLLAAYDLGPVALPLGNDGSAQRFAVVWAETSVATLQIRAKARVFDLDDAGVFYVVPTSDAPAGEPFDLALVGGQIMFGLDAVVTGRNEVIVAWAMSTNASDYSIFARRYDRDLHPKEDAVLLATGLSIGGFTSGPHLSAAFDGDHLLLVWTAGNIDSKGRSDGTTRAFARSFRPDGRTAGELITLGTAPKANDGLVTVTGLPQGGFAAVWRQQLTTSSAGADAVSLRLSALDTFGRRAFTNLACGETDVQLASATAGEIGRAALAAPEDGRLLVAYTVGVGASLSQSDVNLIAVPAHDLFPAGELRSTTTAGGTVGAPPDHYASEHLSCNGARAGTPGLACTCDNSCSDAATCEAEEGIGWAGGRCRLECDPRVTTGCPTGTYCEARSDTSGQCAVECVEDADCGSARFCLQGSCLWICTKDSDCRTGSCDQYSRFCGSGNANPGGGGTLARCSSGDDCRSFLCDTSYDGVKRCQVFCLTDRSPTCPDNGVCIPLYGTFGNCVPSCPTGTCKDPQFDCYTAAGIRHAVLPPALVSVGRSR